MAQINTMILNNEIKSAALRAGFDMCGVARPRLFERNKTAYESWLERGYDSTLEYMRRNLDKRFDVRELVEGAQSVIVCAVSYKSDINTRVKCALEEAGIEIPYNHLNVTVDNK